MYDLIVIGGGVNGTGIARDAAQRGYRTLLVEKRDLAAGSSGANSGMIHGGVRYLRYDRKVTELACLDSGYIQRIAPHLLFRIPFLYPVRARDPRRPTLEERFLRYGVEVYLGVYDDYQPLKRGKPSVPMSAREAYELEPGLVRDLIGAVSMDEWGIDPFRLCAANAISARGHGADVLTYARVVGFHREDGRVSGVEVRDEATGRTELFRGKVIFNATGPWSPRVAAMAGVPVRIRPGKGVHITLDRRVSNYGIICRAVDGRDVFVMPHEQTSIIGTTDDDFYGDPDDLRILEDEVAYLMEAATATMPPVRHARVLRTWAGIRPTVYEYGKTEDALSREHEIIDHAEHGAPGLLSMVGGKLASYRIMAEEAVDEVERQLGVPHRPCRTHEEPLPGGERFPDVALLARETGIPEPTVARIAYRHGSLAEEIVELAQRDPRLAAPVCRCEQVIAAELAWSVRHESARKLVDLRRRNRLAMGPCQGADCALAASFVLARELDLSASEHRRELYELLQERWKGRRSVLDGGSLVQEELSRLVHLGTGLAQAPLPERTPTDVAPPAPHPGGEPVPGRDLPPEPASIPRAGVSRRPHPLPGGPDFPPSDLPRPPRGGT